ncbi:DASH complex subunit dam1 [Linderina macrospora]|uniref:DASH complex subunit dam1 n=1 Tax=Linderina macrospora TaxID=4868 RepID=A0ACC1JGV6_9FUNG|nr:DASH complex subunit dam1 [Linderina macrospora]
MTTRRLSIYPNTQSFEEGLFELQKNVSALSDNMGQLDRINDSLLTFNSNFAVFLQGLRLNSECMEFPEAPNADSYTLLGRPVTPPEPVHVEPAPMLPPQVEHQKSHTESGSLSSTSQGVQQKKRVVIKAHSRKPVFQTRRIIDKLPIRYQSDPYRSAIEQILKELNQNRQGMYVHEIVKAVGSGLVRSKCLDYMNALVRTEFVSRVNKKGHLFLLDPAKFPPK